MTEAEWLSCTNPAPMLEVLRGLATDRKLRLFAVACSRRAWLVIDDLGRAAVEVAESFADRCADAEQLRVARLACKGSGGQSSWYAAVTDPAIAARNAALSALEGATSPDGERLAQADLLRDIFGTPFRPFTFDTAWRTDAVVALAHQMYSSRDFSAMPILADTLQDAGCENNDIAHCCGPGPHTRGCWVVDTVLDHLARLRDRRGEVT